MWLSKKQTSTSELASVSFFDHQSRQAVICLSRAGATENWVDWKLAALCREIFLAIFAIQCIAISG